MCQVALMNEACAISDDDRLAATRQTLVRANLHADEYLAAIIASSSDPIISKNLDGTITSWNRGAEHLFKYTAAEAIGKPISMIVPPERQSEEVEILARLHTGERIENFQTERLRKDGVRVPVSLTISPIRDRRGNIIGASKIARDITELKRAEERTERHVQRLVLLSTAARRLLESTHPLELMNEIFDDAATSFGLDFYFHFVVQPDEQSMRLSAFRGISPEMAHEIAPLPFGQSISGTVARDRKPIVLADVQLSSDPMTEPIRRLGITAYACHPMVANGHLLGTLSFGSRRERHFSPVLIETIGALTDMAATAVARHKAEQAVADARRKLASQTESLETAVRERTAKLEEAIADLETFSYTVSHDLRSPLRTMQGFAHLVLTDYGHQLDDQARDYLQRIDRASARMDTLIMEVLAYSRVARAPLRHEAIDLEQLVDDVIRREATLQPAAANIEIVRPLATVVGNRSTLTQSVQHLLGNAVKFVPPGATPHITISTERHASDIRLLIRDRGIGISPQGLQHVFKPFHRAHPEASYPGTGMGLAMVKRAIDRQGGTVGVLSVPGEGSTFWIQLPAANPTDTELNR
jgi:PAS domain S-box-containing protein